MGEAKERVEHCLALKVMRLTKPTFGSPALPAKHKSDLMQDLLIDSLKRDLNSLESLEELNLGSLLILPQSFGNIYLGETFSSYVCVHNDSTQIARNISIKADLQTATQRIGLVNTQDRATMSPGETINHVLHHEVKELGTHILVCDVTYAAHQNDKMNFRKFFKFQVMKPLDVKTKFYNAESDEVFLEAQVQNITVGNINLDRVSLEPSSVFSVRALKTGGEDNEAGVFTSGTALQSQDCWQYLFCLTPRPEMVTDKALSTLTNIGKLDIVWRTALCDKGRLQTSQLQRQPPSSGDIKVAVIAAPALALLYQPIQVHVRITNNCDRTVELEQSCEEDEARRVVWVGTTNANLGLLEPGGSIKVRLEVVLQGTGLVTLSGLKLMDSLLSRIYPVPDLGQVYVVEEAEQLSNLNTRTDNTRAQAKS